MRDVQHYPWASLAVFSRGAVREERRLRRGLPAPFSAERIGEAFCELLAADVRVEVLRAPASLAPRGADRAVFLQAADESLSLWIELEPALASLVLSRVLGRPVALARPDAALDESTRGALSAVLVEGARRAIGTVPLRARPDMTASRDGARLDVAVFVDARPYRAVVFAWSDERPTAATDATPSLESLGDLPLRLRLAAALSTVARSDLAELRPGDVWLPGAGWLGDVGAGDALAEGPARRTLTRAALSPPCAERGVEVGRSGEGRLVLRGGIIALGADVTDTEAGRGGDDDAMSGPDETLTDLVLEAPVVVRVEVGSVTLSAREWASLRPGDVLETGLRLSEPVVLRVAGREVARGELVSVEGELGVRIRELVRAEAPD